MPPFFWGLIGGEVANPLADTCARGAILLGLKGGIVFPHENIDILLDEGGERGRGESSLNVVPEQTKQQC